MKKQLLAFLMSLFGVIGYAQYGCTDSSALNFDSTAVYDDSTCYYDIYGCTDTMALNYDYMATVDNGSCYFDTIQEVYGCTDTMALNYDYMATMDNGSCSYDTIQEVYGCTDGAALNFDYMATIDDGSCVADSVVPVFGCTISSALNYDQLATIDNGSCQFMDTLTNETLIGTVYGCMDANAENFVLDANVDNDSCIYAQDFTGDVPVCLDVDALTYNGDATIHDRGLCIYDQDTVNHVISVPEIIEDTSKVEVSTCTVDFSILIDSAVIVNATLTNDGLDVVWTVYQRGNSVVVTSLYEDVYEASTQLLYLTVSCGNDRRVRKSNTGSRTLRAVLKSEETETPTSIYNVDEQFEVYPNPSTTGYFEIAGNEIKQYQVYNISGSLVSQGVSVVVDLSGQKPGVYF